MTTPSTTRKAGPLQGNGSATAFPFAFKVFAASDIKVVIANSANVETILVLNTDYSVSLNANQDTSPGGTVTYPISGSALPSGSVLSIIGNLDYSQPLDLPSGGNFSPLALENQLDRTTMQIQQLKEQVDRSAKLPVTYDDSDLEAFTEDIVRLADSADNIDTVVANLADITTVANDLNEPVSEINTVANAIANVNAVGSNIGNVNIVAGIPTNDITTVATNVADITNFADVYYGPQGSDPTTRSDGSARQIGDLYFNTGSKRMRVFDSTTWVEASIDEPGTYTIDRFSGNGSTTAFTLSVSPISENNTQVYIGGVYQQKDQYSVSGTTLTFASAPPSGTNNIEVLTAVTIAYGATDAANVAYGAAGSGAVTRTVTDRLRETVSVADFGAVGDGVTDDYQAFVDALTAASGGTVFVPDPDVAYKIATAKITVPANTQLVGQSRHRTRLDHAFNGDMFELADGAGLQNVWLVGDGANYTGRAILYTSTNGRQGVIGVRASDWDGAVQDFAVAAGSQSVTEDCRFSRRNAGTGTGRYAIVISPTQQLAAVPRTFIGIQTDGTCAFDFGGCNNVYVSNSFLGDLNYTAESRAVLITGTRIANQLALTIDGNNNVIVGCDIAPQITIASTTDNVALQGNSYNNLPIINNSGNGRNLIDTWYRPYTPTLTSGGTAPSLGNGAIVGGVCSSGATTTITGQLTIGSTTSLGTGGLKISLPQQRQSNDVVIGGVVYANIGGVIYEGFMQIAGAVSVADMLRDTTGSITFNSPAVFNAGDFIRWSFTYPT